MEKCSRQQFVQCVEQKGTWRCTWSMNTEMRTCVCVWGGGWYGAGESRRISPAPKLLLLSKCSRKGGSKCFIHPAEYSHVLNLIVTQGEVTRYTVDDNRIHFSQIVRTVLLWVSAFRIFWTSWRERISAWASASVGTWWGENLGNALCMISSLTYVPHGFMLNKLSC